MKNCFQKILAAFILTTVISLTTNAQTNVSGGIYTNATWTLANSPYVVTDTVVVFPNVTLTIEPGVTVKFADHTYIEIRHSSLIANGNAVDSITFTSNSPSPTPGIWGDSYYGGIWLNSALVPTSFNFINIKYATIGIYNGFAIGIKNSAFTNNITGLHSMYNVSIDSCIFKFNSNGLDNANGCTFNFCNISNNTSGIANLTFGTMVNCVIDSNQGGLGDVDQAKIYNCTINYNHTGIVSGPCCSGRIKVENCIVDYNSTMGLAIFGDGEADSIINCEIKFNGIGLIASACPDVGGHGLVTQNIIESNTTGIEVGGCFNIYCNKICNNTSYDLQNGGFPYSVPNNYWCTTDSSTIETHIYDGYDNVSLGLVTFMPVDSTCAPGITTSVNETAQGNMQFSIFPNPATDNLTVQLPANSSKTEIKIVNMLDELVFSSTLTTEKTSIDISGLMSGAYIVQIATADKISRQKLIRQ